MTLNQLISQLQEMVKDDSSLGDLPVYQMSCFDSPLTFSTSGAYVTTIYEADENHFVNQDEAQTRADESETEVTEIGRVLILEAF